MKISELLQPVFESPFTPRNFPEQPNKHIVGAGERTVYAELPVNQQGGQGFRVMKNTKVVRGKGVAELTANTRIFWTMPGKLFSAEELGEKGTSKYAAFGIRSSSPADSIGLIPISVVEKPSKVANRVLTGKAGQEAVFQYLVSTFSDQFQSIEQTHIAKVGSTKADLIVKFDQVPIQFEIKNSSSKSAPLTLFDKTVRRDKPNELIDSIVAAMTGNPNMTLTKVIDFVRKTDTTIGYPGDKGVGKSGKFTGMRVVRDNPNMQATHDFIVDHFVMSGDNYFAVNYGNNNVSLFFTGKGKNVLNAPEFPLPAYVDLRTYGGPSAGGMRMGVKIKL